MDLKPFVGKKVLMQFKPQTAYAVCTTHEGLLAPLMMKGPEGPQPIIVPYIDGTIEMEEGVAGSHPDAYFLVYNDQAHRGSKLRVAVSPDLIGFVTVQGEERTASVLITP